MKQTTQHIKAIRSIPKEKFRAKVARTVLGLFTIGLALLVQREFEFPSWLEIGLLGFGFYSLSGELVTKFLGFLPAAIRDILGAVQRNNG